MLPSEEVTLMMRGSFAFWSRGVAARVTRVGPTTLVSKMACISERVGQVLSAGSGQMPALLMRMSRRPKDWEIEAKAEVMEESDVTSSWMREADPGLFLDLIFSSDVAFV